MITDLLLANSDINKDILGLIIFILCLPIALFGALLMNEMADRDIRRYTNRNP
jgi:hypothetical protein